MPGYLIYLPDRGGCTPQHLRDVGLGDLLARGDTTPLFADVLHGGPDGGRGLLAFFDHADYRRAPRPVIDLASQEWQPAKARDGLPAGRFWLGRDRGTRIEPEDLARRFQHAGVDVILEDGQAWHVPVARQLPCVLGLDSTGHVAGRVREEYAAFWEASKEILGLFVVDDPGSVKVPVEEGFRFCAQALSVNYRVNVDVVDFLGLVGSSALAEIPLAVCEIREQVEFLEKKNEGCATPSIAAGEPA